LITNSKNIDQIQGIQFNDIIESKRHELEDELADTKLLQSISAELLYEDNIQALYERIIDTAAQIMRSEYASMQMLHPERGDSGELQLLASKGFNPQASRFWEWVGIDAASTCGVALRTRQRVIVSDLEKCDYMQETEDLATYLDTGIHACQTTPLLSRSGKILGMISTHWSEPHQPSERELRLLDVLARQAADLIERKQIEEALRKADQNKSQFISSLSHELRNPLASIMMSLSLLKHVSPGSEQALQAREIMERQTIQLSHLVDDLLDVTRISQNKIELRKELVELNSLVSKTIEDYKPMFIEKEVSMEVILFSKLLNIQADPTRLTQVIGNLLHNSLKFSDKGGKTQVIVSKSENNYEAVVEVKDNGLGIKSEILPNLFQPFMQADMSLDRSRGGLGLGLAIVKGMVELHGGSVTAHSEGLGKGAQFSIRLPLLQGNDGKQEQQQQKEDGKTICARRIIVIDDIPDVAEILCSLLRHLGHEVTSASNGPKGLAKALEFTPEVIICDIGLPGMNGYEVARRIRSDNKLKDIFLIALSGYAQEDDKVQAMEAGFNKHLAKPVDLGILEKILKEIP